MPAHTISMLASRRTTPAALIIKAAALLGAVASSAQAQTIIQGPVYSPVTGSRYYVVQVADWNQARAFAQSRGGTLATIESAAENSWINLNLTLNGTRSMFIGLNDADTEGTLRWADGSTSTYRNWLPGEPNNTAANDYAMTSGPGAFWALRGPTAATLALVEVSGDLRVPSELPTLQAALAFANDITAPVTIVLAPGDYLVNDALRVKQRITIRGESRTGTVIRRNAGNEIMFGFEQRTVASIENLTLRCDRGGSSFLRAIDIDAELTLRDVNMHVFNNTNVASTVLQGFKRLHLDGCIVSGIPTLIGEFLDAFSIVTATNTAFANVARLADADALGRFDASNCIFHAFVGGTFTIPPTWDVSISNSLFSAVPSIAQVPQLKLSHCVVPNSQLTGPGNIVGLPRYVNPAALDFRPLPGSPGVDAGNPAALFALGLRSQSDAAGNPRFADDPATPNAPTTPADLALDIGPFEVPVSTCDADFNGDGSVDFFDYLDFVQAFDSGC